MVLLCGLVNLNKVGRLRAMCWFNGSTVKPTYRAGSYITGGRFLRKLWCCVGGAPVHDHLV